MVVHFGVMTLLGNVPASLLAPWQWEAIGQLFLASVLGGVVGMERQYHGRAAGFRTNLLVCVGCCLVMITSLHFARHYAQEYVGQDNIIRVDPARLAYSVMGGIGFLGAGAIIKAGVSIRGLTTAASMWCVAAIGLAVGFGMYVVSVAATALVIFALFVLNVVEGKMKASWYKLICVVCKDDPAEMARVERILKDHDIHVLDLTFDRDVGQGMITITYNVRLRDRRQTGAVYSALAQHEGLQSVKME